MKGFPPARFSESEQGLFTPREIRHLMRIEFERAMRYEYPLVLMLAEIDRLEYLHDLYGFESREEILQAVVSKLRSMTRESDFLGCLMGNRVMAVFPHTSLGAARALAGRFLRSVRQLTFQSDGRTIRSTLSIGMSFADPGRATTYEQWFQDAEEALAFANDSGGDRFVQRESATDLIQGLREDLEREAQRLASETAPVVPPAPVSRPEVPPAGSTPAPRPPNELDFRDLPGASLPERITNVFQAFDGASDELDRLREQVLVAAADCMRLAKERARSDMVDQHQGQIEVLERRVVKLKGLLDLTEGELRRVARTKGIDPGVASIYRTVQGVSGDDDEVHRKNDMLTLIFEANVNLRNDIQKKKSD